MPTIVHVAVGILCNPQQQILIAKRPDHSHQGGLWEFPGGKVEGKETYQDALVRELKEETTLTVEVQDKVISVPHAFTHFKITLHAFNCRIVSGVAQAISSDDIRWVSIQQLADYPFPTANKKIIQALSSC